MFLQVLVLYDYYFRHIRIQCMYFSNNSANISGSTLYRGLLDRCAVSPFAEIYKYYSPNSIIGGIGYFKNVSFTTNESIPSGPVQVCLCTNYSMTAPIKIVLMLKRERHSQYRLLLLIRLANWLVQPSKPTLALLRVI